VVAFDKSVKYLYFLQKSYLIQQNERGESKACTVNSFNKENQNYCRFGRKQSARIAIN
jgi:hypothetical protein